MNPSDFSPTPFAECYWVVPGWFLAGEFPGARRLGQPSPRITALLEAGITRFYDLTRPGELPDYEDALVYGVTLVGMLFYGPF